MMYGLSQILAATGIGLRSIPQRLGNSLVIVIGIAAVAAVLTSVLAMSDGFSRTIRGGARSDRIVVLTRNANEESASSFSREQVAALQNVPGLRRDSSDLPIVSAEVVLVAPVVRKASNTDAYITLRGVGPQAMQVRPEVRMYSGRMFEPGLHELIVGRAAQQQFSGLEAGGHVRLHDGDWLITGVFEAGDNVRESELLADSQTVLSSYKLDAFNSVTALLDGERALDTVHRAVAADPTLEVKVLTEPDYLDAVSGDTHRLLEAVALVIGTMMAVGALFGALNTMYSSVAARSREIATLRAIGFAPGVVLASVLIEALLLALVGACVGVAIAYLAFDGNAISTLGGSRWDSQLVYSLTITPSLMAIAAAIACAIGGIGGLLPAWRAIRQPIAQSLQTA